MNAIAVRRAALAGSVLAVTAALTTAPVVTDTASAATTVEICNSPQSTAPPYDWFRVVDSSRGTSIKVGRSQCVVVTNTTYLRVTDFGGTVPQGWNVRSVPGEFGACHGGVSNPGSGPKYAYRVGC